MLTNISVCSLPSPTHNNAQVPLAKLHRDGVIELSHYQMGDNAAVAFSEVVRRNQIEHLNASHCGIRRSGAVAICRSLSDKPQLRYLNLAGNAIDREGALTLSHALRTTKGSSEVSGIVRFIDVIRILLLPCNHVFCMCVESIIYLYVRMCLRLCVYDHVTRITLPRCPTLAVYVLV
jgi:hypothetical protein